MEDDKPFQWINVVLSEINLLEEKKGRKIIEKCGRDCAKSHDIANDCIKIRNEVENKNDFDHLFSLYKEKIYKNSPRLYKEAKIIYLEYHECGCPFVKSGKVENPFFCNCTRGYTKERFETLFGKPVKVELLKSILKGDKICKQAITIEE